MIDLPPSSDDSTSGEVPRSNEEGIPAADPQPNKKRPAPSTRLRRELDEFIQHVNSLNDTLPLSIIAIQAGAKIANDRYDEFVAKYCSVEKTSDGEVIRFDAEHQEKFVRVRRRRNQADLAFQLVPRSLIVALVSQFDAFVGGLIRTYYTLHPEALSSSERSLTLAQLQAFGSIESATDYILEKEVESVLRKSHAEQFDWMESRFGIPLRHDLESWPTFIELTERRNLFVHTGGVVSSQYLAVCNKHGASSGADAVLGELLTVTPEYFQTAYECLFGMAVKLGHVFWRKMLPKERDKADSHLVSVTYDLIGEAEYNLAKDLLDFAVLTLKKHASENNRRILVVNRAQAYKWLGDSQRAREIMDAEDWSATNDSFRIANAVLRDDFEKAAAIMKQIGKSGSLTRSEYLGWPLFRAFRKSAQFASAYEEVFGEPFNVLAKERTTETKSRPEESLAGGEALSQLPDGPPALPPAKDSPSDEAQLD